MKPNTILISVLCLSLGVLFSCSPTRRLPENKFLLSKNQVIIDNKQDIDLDLLNSVIRQKPNRKLFKLFRFHLGLYNLVDPQKAENEKNRKIQKRKAKNKKRESKGKMPKSLEFRTKREYLMQIGEAPAILDSMQTKLSSKQLNLFLLKKGYFNNSVSDTTIYDGQKAQVQYNIVTGIPYRINEITYTLNDPKLEHYLKEDGKKQTLIKIGDRYDEDNLSKERDRITNILQNLGYFNFVKEYIHYRIDTSLGSNRLNINIEIKNPEIKLAGTDSIVETRHKQYYINKIFVNTKYNPRNPNAGFTDTLYYHDFYFIHNKDLKYKPNILTQRIFLKTGDFYRLRNLKETYNKLSDLRSFKFVNIHFKEENSNPENNLINCYIMLSPLVGRSLDFAQEITNRGGNNGVAGNIVYRSNNPFGGNENLEFKLRGGFEAQQFDNFSEETNNLFFFNSKEIGPEITLTTPKFLFPRLKPERISKYWTPKTTFTVAYNFQERPELTRNLLNISLGYNWKSSVNRTFYLFPIEINIVNIDPKRGLNDFFKRINNPFIERSFTPHATEGFRFVYLYNNQSPKKNRDFTFFRGSVEQAGTLLRGVFVGLDKLDLAKKNEFGSYEITKNTPFAQYLKVDIDYRYYKVFNPKNSLVIRGFAGAGIPHTNLTVLPLEKSYFGGGSNSIRAWAARSLGPGSYNDTSTFNALRIGDISLETNLEYRFNLYKILEGAFFLDAGNIWLVKPDKARPGGNFESLKSLNEIAIGSGFGLRLDFSFFVFRLDLGVKLRDPMIQDDDKWVIKHFIDSKWILEQNQKNTRNYFTNINFGIGYPF